MPRKEAPEQLRRGLGREFWLLVAMVTASAIMTRPDRRSGKRQPGAAVAFDTSLASEPMQLQRARAHQPGRGRKAEAPWAMPWRGWRDILLRTYQQIGTDRLLAIAAGVVFYALLALFPALTALVSFYGLFAKASDIGQHLAFLVGIIPGGAYDIVQDQIARLVAKEGGQLGLGFVFGLALALWSANAGMKAMIDALNVVYGETEKRGFFALNLTALALTIGGLAIALLALAVVIVVPVVLSSVGLDSATEWAVSLLRWPAMLVVLALALAVLYRVGPSRRQARWQWISVGCVVASVLWIAGSALFSFYLSHFADYDAAYGSLGAAIGLMMWMWLTTIIVLLGAELNSEIEHQTARDSTIGRPKPLGARHAVMADTVGASQS